MGGADKRRRQRGWREAEHTQRRHGKTASLLKALIDATCMCLLCTLQANGQGELKGKWDGRGRWRWGARLLICSHISIQKNWGKKKQKKNKRAQAQTSRILWWIINLPLNKDQIRFSLMLCLPVGGILSFKMKFPVDCRLLFAPGSSSSHGYLHSNMSGNEQMLPEAATDLEVNLPPSSPRSPASKLAQKNRACSGKMKIKK